MRTDEGMPSATIPDCSREQKNAFAWSPSHSNGIVVHPMCKIGPNCHILRQIILGTNGSQVNNGGSTLVGHVDIGAGAKILGPLTIGDHAGIELRNV